MAIFSGFGEKLKEKHRKYWNNFAAVYFVTSSRFLLSLGRFSVVSRSKAALFNGLIVGFCFAQVPGNA